MNKLLLCVFFQCFLPERRSSSLNTKVENFYTDEVTKECVQNLYIKINNLYIKNNSATTTKTQGVNERKMR